MEFTVSLVTEFPGDSAFCKNLCSSCGTLGGHCPLAPIWEENQYVRHLLEVQHTLLDLWSGLRMAGAVVGALLATPLAYTHPLEGLDMTFERLFSHRMELENKRLLLGPCQGLFSEVASLCSHACMMSHLQMVAVVLWASAVEVVP